VGNLVTPDSIAAIHDIERSIYQFAINRKAARYLPGVKSMLTYFYAPDGKYTDPDAQYTPLTMPQVSAVLEYIGSDPSAHQEGFPVPIGPAVYSFFGQSFTAQHPKSNFLTTKFTIYEAL
jgi:hypothetical protein